MRAIYYARISHTSKINHHRLDAILTRLTESNLDRSSSIGEPSLLLLLYYEMRRSKFSTPLSSRVEIASRSISDD